MSFPDQQHAEPFTLASLTSPTGGPTPRPPRPSRWPLVIAGIAVLALVVGAVTVYTLWPEPSSSSSTTAPAPSATTGAPAAAAPTTGAPSPAAPKTHKLSEAVTTSAGRSRVTAYAYKQPVAPNAPRPDQDGYEWAAADVEVCALIDGGYTNHLPWGLVYADHTVIEPSSIGYRGFPQPEFPWGDKDLPKDRCIRGWITYAVPAGKRPVAIEHSTTDDSTTEWAIA